MLQCKDDIRNWKGPLPSVPLHLRNAPTKMMREMSEWIFFSLIRIAFLNNIRTILINRLWQGLQRKTQGRFRSTLHARRDGGSRLFRVMKNALSLLFYQNVTVY